MKQTQAIPVSAADTMHPITVLHQAGSPWVFQKSLVSPLHMGPHLRCLDFLVAPMHSHVPIGEHTRNLEMLYYLDQGRGTLTLDGQPSRRVQASDLLLAPRGAQARLHNDTRESLSLLAIGVEAPAASRPTTHLAARPPRVQIMEHLPGLCQVREELVAQVGQRSVPVNVGQIALDTCFAGAWGHCFLLELPAQGCLSSIEHAYDENLFVVRGQALIELHIGQMEAPFHTGSDPTAGLNLLIPAGVRRHMTNVSATETLWLLIVQIGRGSASV